jgi:hypothetical protein
MFIWILGASATIESGGNSRWGASGASSTSAMITLSAFNPNRGVGKLFSPPPCCATHWLLDSTAPNYNLLLKAARRARHSPDAHETLHTNPSSFKASSVRSGKEQQREWDKRAAGVQKWRWRKWVASFVSEWRALGFLPSGRRQVANAFPKVILFPRQLVATKVYVILRKSCVLTWMCGDNIEIV